LTQIIIEILFRVRFFGVEFANAMMRHGVSPLIWLRPKSARIL
jgi:hypothetical protein